MYKKSALLLLLLILMIAGCKTAEKQTGEIAREKTKIYTAQELKISDIFLQAVTDKELGNIAAATEKLQQVIRLCDGKFAPAHYYLADVLFSQKQWNDAVAHAEKAVELDPQNRWYKLALATLYQQLSQHEKACKIFETIVKEEPNVEAYYFEWANSYIASGDANNALKVMDKYEKRFGVTEVVSLQKRTMLLEMNKPEEAVAEVEKLQKAFPMQPKYNAILAETYMKEKNYAKAQQYYHEILRLSPDDPHIHISLSNLYRMSGENEKAYTELQLGFANPNLPPKTKVELLDAFYTANGLTQGEWQQVDTLLHILLAAHHNNAEAYSIAGAVYFNFKEMTAAEETLKKAQLYGDQSFRVMEQLIFLLSVQPQKKEELLALCNRAIDLYPEQPLPYLFKGNVLMYQENNNVEAIKVLQNGLQWVAENPRVESDFNAMMGEGYHRMEDHENSDKHFRKALKINSGDYLTMNNFAYYLSQRGTSLDEAQKLIENVLKVYPEEATFLDTYAWVLFKRGNCLKAKQVMEKYLVKKTASSEQLLHYAEILEQCGDKIQSQHFFQQASDRKKEEQGRAKE